LKKLREKTEEYRLNLGSPLKTTNEMVVVVIVAVAASFHRIQMSSLNAKLDFSI